MKAEGLKSELRDYICRTLKEGFHAPDAVRQSAIEYFSDEHGEDQILDCINEILEQAIAARQAEHATWPKVTDCDRLDAAFEELNRMGIMARHDWACCSNCGRAEMPDEFDRLDGQCNGVPIIGYSFYHQQDTERAAEGDGLSLNFGSTEAADNEDAYIQQCLKVAQTVQQVLEKHGLTVLWNGTYEQRPHVAMQWRRRMPPPRFCGDPESGAC